MDDLCQPWPIDPGCTFGIPVNPADRDEQQVAAVAVASEIMWRLTGGQWGTCPAVVRPCRETPEVCDIPREVLYAWGWTPIGCPCVPKDSCGCTAVSKVKLPGPIASITEVLLDGEVLPQAGNYEVWNRNLLVRMGGQQWPLCQDMTKPTTEPGTWSVTYERGRAVPAGGRRAMAELAAEIIKACTPGAKCQLPTRVQSISREGITMSIIDNFDFLEKGRTGIASIDLWLNAVNPKGVRSPMRVYSPDMTQTVSTTWPF